MNRAAQFSRNLFQSATAFGCFVFLGTPGFLHSNPVPARLFSDHMVIQRDAVTTFWGRGEEKEWVSVEVAGVRGQAQVSGGVFQIPLKVPGAGGPHRLVFKGKTEVVFQDVFIGDVWVCAGGMNMDQPVSALPDRAAYLERAPGEGVRLLRTSKQVLDQRGIEDVALVGAWSNGWALAGSNAIPSFSALAAAFGTSLAQKSGVKIGLIQAAYGNAPLECWMPRETLEAVPELRRALGNWQRAMDLFPVADSNFQIALSNWQVATEAAKSNGSPLPKRPDEPMGPRHERRPGGLYWGMIAPLQKLAVKGIVYYGGESHSADHEAAVMTATVFPALIDTWRRHWNEGALPFGFVQIPGFRRPAGEPEDSPLSHLRESMAKASALTNVGMAGTLDLGEEADPLPKKKRAMGERLAQWALANGYGQPGSPSPILGSTTLSLGKATLRFKNVGSGLVAGAMKVDKTQLSTNVLRGFALCGPDRRFYWAEAHITGPETVELTSPKVTEAMAVRYAWSGFPLANLTTVDGTPVLPFRTDHFPPAYAFQAEGVAIGKTVTASDPASENTYQGLCDGSLLDSAKTVWASGISITFPKWVSIDLGRLYAVKEIRLYPSSFGGTRSVDVSVSVDGMNFTPYDSASFSNRIVEPEIMPNSSRDGIRHVRLSFPDCHVPGFLGQTNTRVSLREVEVIGSPVK